MKDIEKEYHFIIGHYKRVDDVSYFSLFGIRIYKRVWNVKKLFWYSWGSNANN